MRRWKMLALAVPSAVFTAGGVWMIVDGNAKGYFVAVFFGLCILVFAFQCLPISSYLGLISEGLTLRSRFHNASLIPWRDVDSFFVAKIGL
jgi:hypothetical protein